MRHQVIILADAPDVLIELCGISLIERLLRQLQRLGLQRVIILSATPERLARHLANPSPHRARVAIDLQSRSPGLLRAREIGATWPNDAERVLIIRGDSVFDPRLFQFLDEQDAPSVLIDSAPEGNDPSLPKAAPKTSRGWLCGAALLSRPPADKPEADLTETLRGAVEAGRIATIDIASRGWHLPSMRRDLRPYWFPVPAAEKAKNAERVLLDAAQKGTLDLPALVHAPIENFLVSQLCKTSVSPNQLTFFSNLVAWSATFLFATGRLGWGVIFALAVGVIDGLDGKQARVKIETTKAGKLEHWFDAFFEHSWWIAIAYYLQSSGRLSGAFFYLIILMGAEAAAGLAKLGVIRSCGRTLDELGDFNRLVRLIGGRRNVYVWVFTLGVLLGAAAEAFRIMSLWAAVTAAIQLFRAALAVRFHRERRTSPELPAEA